MPLYLSSIVRTDSMGIVHSHEDEGKLAFLKKFNTRHFHISHNAPYLPPKILHNLCFSFSWVLQLSQEKLKTVLMQNFLGKIRCIIGIVKVAYSTKHDFLYSSSAICTSSVTHLVCPPKFFHNPCTLFPLSITVVPREIKDC